MNHDRQTRTPFMEDLRILCQQITTVAVDSIPPAMLEEMVGVGLLYAEGIVNTVRIPLLVLDATLHVLMANRYFYECFQVTLQETVSHRLYDLGNGQWNIPALRGLLEYILPQHTAFDDFEVVHTFPYIGPKHMLLNARQIVRTPGIPPLILLAIEDITTRWQAEQILRQQRDLLAVTLDSIGDAVLTTNSTGRITFLNPVAEALTGWPLQDALGQPCERVFRLVHAWTRQPLESPVARVLRDGLVIDLPPQTVLITRDGRELPIADLSAPIRHEYERTQGVVVVFRDMSASQRVEQQQQQGHKMEALGTLAGGIAHDFNNILATILGSTELVQYHLALNSPAQPYLQKALTAVQRGKALVQQILAFSHVTPPERTPVSLAAVIRDTLPLVRALLPATIVLEMQLTSEPSMVLADTTQMQQIVMNLSANAEYAMRDTGGSLAVHLEAVEVDAGLAATHPALRVGPYVRLTMRDSGAGIPPVVLTRIFEPFFTTKEVGQGTGLGLSIVHGIVESHDGTILVESTPGQGTTFTIYLPRFVPGEEGDPQ
jgi:PAS domain S-box-containing protein